MKYKYEDLKSIIDKLDKHSQKGDIEIYIDVHTKALVFDYVSNVGTETVITTQVSENNAFVTISETKWLKAQVQNATKFDSHDYQFYTRCMGTIIMLAFLSTTSTFNLPHGLLPALCYVESSHRVNAVHHDDGGSDSLGLCQIKLKTARYMGFKGTRTQLMDPVINTYYAGRYLNAQLHRYNGNIEKALTAYNRGNAKGLARSRYSNKVLKVWRQYK